MLDTSNQNQANALVRRIVGVANQYRRLLSDAQALALSIQTERVLEALEGAGNTIGSTAIPIPLLMDAGRSIINILTAIEQLDELDKSSISRLLSNFGAQAHIGG